MIFIYVLLFSIFSLSLQASQESNEYTKAPKLNADKAKELIELHKHRWEVTQDKDAAFRHEIFCDMSVAYYCLAQAQEKQAEVYYIFAKRMAAQVRISAVKNPSKIELAHQYAQAYKRLEEASRTSYEKAQKYINYAVSLHPPKQTPGA